MFSKNKKFVLGLLVLVITVVLLIPKVVRAGLDEAIAKALTWVVLGLTNLVGKLVVLVVRLLVSVAQYNDFFNSPVVAIGWVVIRDICNMFFVLALLVVAFCSVLGIEQYSWKRALGGLILAIILVNFSKLIIAFIIDIAQMVMLTFVNAFKEAGERNFAEMFGLKQLLDYGRVGTAGEVVGAWELFLAACLALILTIVALVASIVMTILLVFRIVVLWFLMLFSPLPFLFGLFSQTSGFARQFWDRFTNQVIIGPILAFCLWLSLAVVQQSVSNPSNPGGLSSGFGQEVTESAQGMTEGLLPEAQEGGQGSDRTLAATVTSVGRPVNLLSFVIGIVLLVGSLSMAQQLGVAGGAWAGKMAGKMQTWGAGATKLTVRVSLKGAAKGAARAWESIGAGPTVRAGWERFTTETGFGRWIKRRYSKEEREKMRQEKEILSKARVGLIPKEAALMEIRRIKGAPIHKRLEERGIFENMALFIAHWQKLIRARRTDELIEMARVGAQNNWLDMDTINNQALARLRPMEKEAISNWIRSQHGDILARVAQQYEWDETKRNFRELPPAEREKRVAGKIPTLRPDELANAFKDALNKASLKVDPITGQIMPNDREVGYRLGALEKSDFSRLPDQIKKTVLDALLLLTANKNEFRLTEDDVKKFEQKYVDFAERPVDKNRQTTLRADQHDKLLEQQRKIRTKGGFPPPPSSPTKVVEELYNKIENENDPLRKAVDALSKLSITPKNVNAEENKKIFENFETLRKELKSMEGDPEVLRLMNGFEDLKKKVQKAITEKRGALEIKYLEDEIKRNISEFKDKVYDDAKQHNLRRI